MQTFHETPDEVTFNVKVVPRAKRDEIVGVENDAVKIRLNAPPVDGRANEALVRFLAKALGTTQASIELVRGETSRHKRIRVRGMRADALRQKLGID